MLTLPSDPKPPSPRIAAGVRFALAHWILLLVLQFENFVSTLLLDTEGFSAFGYFALNIFADQVENVLAAAFLGVIAWAIAPLVWGRRLYFLGYALISVLCIADHAFYRLFFQHVRFSGGDGIRVFSPRLLLDSLFAASDLWLVLDGFIVLGGLAWLAFGWFSEAPPRLPRFRWFAVPATFCFLFGQIFQSDQNRYPGLSEHPLSGLVRERFESPLPEKLKTTPSARAAPPAPANGAGDSRLAVAKDGIRAKAARPNVVLIVLESVAAPQLLTANGLPDPKLTPHLARLAEHAVILPAVYSVFPGTVRTHIALNTGGRHLTWGNVFDLLAYDYDGPMLARTFREAGWRAGLFSSARLDGEAMDQFMARAGYGTLYDFSKDRASHTRTIILNSWGAREEHTLGLIKPWIEEAKASADPWLLTWLTVATHHPYGVPAEFPRLKPGDDDLSRYQNALHYTDSAVGDLLAFLEAQGLRENTIIAVTGDHGQAFGQLHTRNYIHKNYLYDENVRSFLMIAHPAIGETIQARRIGSTGDIFPTLAAVAGLAVPVVPGRDLLAAEDPPRFIFFHKNSYPEHWGLRDGQWKFTENVRDRSRELYDLSADPNEQRNLADSHGVQVQGYSTACEEWFLATDADFVAHLHGYQYAGGRGLQKQELREPGPKLLAVGYRVPDINGRFVAREVVPPDKAPVTWTRWTTWESEVPISYRWTAPSGAIATADTKAPASVATNVMEFPGSVPLESGVWKVAVLKDGAPLLESTFKVDPSAPAAEGE